MRLGLEELHPGPNDFAWGGSHSLRFLRAIFSGKPGRRPSARSHWGQKIGHSRAAKRHVRFTPESGHVRCN